MSEVENPAKTADEVAEESAKTLNQSAKVTSSGTEEKADKKSTYALYVAVAALVLCVLNGRKR